MRYREYLESKLGDSLPSDVRLPRKFHVVGHVALVQLDSHLLEYATKIGEMTLEFDKRVESVGVKVGPTSGITRQPSYILVAGKKDTVTTHIENGVKFRLDPLRLTFSGGNRRERMRLSRLVEDGEYVVDMFSCVGQFALHVAKSANVNVTAIEINPEAFQYLGENIKLNGLEQRVTAVLGDCREVHPKRTANRIIMGYLHDTIDYLPFALETLVEDEGIIHMHMNSPESKLRDIIMRIEEISRNNNFSSTTNIQHVKNYSPGIGHYVFDITLTSEA